MKLTVIRLAGNLKPLFLSAALTLSRASLIEVAANPTIWKFGKPFAMSTSTEISCPSIPTRVHVGTLENIFFPLLLFNLLYPVGDL